MSVPLEQPSTIDPVTQLVIDELGQYDQLLEVMRGQLANVNVETGDAAQSILKHLSDVDTRIRGMLAYLDQSGESETVADLLARTEKRTQETLRLLAAFREQREKDGEDGKLRLSEIQTMVAGLYGAIDRVRDIAKQTKMLAFNATIEAAHAGDKGCGFAVVAAEMRQLSQASDQAAVEIQHGIATLDQVTSVSIQAMAGERLVAERSGFESVSTSIGELTENLGRLVGHQRDVLKRARQESNAIATLILNLIGAIQFQDITRQQLDQVAAALLSLSRHTDELRDCLEGFGPNESFESLRTKVEDMLSQYVMAQQRNVHQAVVGNEKQETVASLIELF
jgi:methyl-accepting chemotaxis protein